MKQHSPVTQLLSFLAIVLAASAVTAAGAPVHPIEDQLRAEFPSLALDAGAPLQPAQMLVAGRTIAGLRAAQASLRFFYPSSYNDMAVAEAGSERVVMRAVDARFTPVASAGGKLFYAAAYDSVDAIEIPHAGRSEELLLLKDERAPLVFDYEIVETSGVARVALADGEVRFIAERAAAPAAGPRFSLPQPSLQIERPWVVDSRGTRRAAEWTIVEEKDRPRRIRLTVDAHGLEYPIVVDPSFTVTGSMTTARRNATATLLSNGKVLVAGGQSTGGGATNTAEVYDDATGTFTPATGMNAAREFHTAVALPDGKVLIAGGFDGVSALGSAELFDPSTGTFTPTGSMTTGRSGATATLLPNGKVLIAGGATSASAELFDPAGGTNGTFTAVAASMNAVRSNHTAALLPNGKVLIAGGLTTGGVITNSAELYDPAAGTNGTFTATGTIMNAPRENHTATLLATGLVLLAGGTSTGSTVIGSAELYDPAGDAFTPVNASMMSPRTFHSATLLPNGTVLLAGGYFRATYLNTSEIFDPAAAFNGSFTSSAFMNSSRMDQSATLLPNGRVLVAGGFDGVSEVTSAELYDSAVNVMGVPVSMNQARDSQTATPLPNGKVLIAGGESGPTTSTAELFDPGTGLFGGTLTTTQPRNGQTATLLPNGKVLLAGSGTGPEDSAELYDPIAGTFTPVSAAMTIARYDHVAALLPNGKVLLVGGNNGGVFLNSAELYDPSAGTNGTFTATSTLPTVGGAGMTATLLPNGKVLVAGGGTGFGHSANLYDPATDTFTPTGNEMATLRSSHSATLLPDGKVLLAGGSSSTTVLMSAELYDPATNLFTGTGSLTLQRYGHTATLLPNGKVLIAGGYTGTVFTKSMEIYDPFSGTFSAAGTILSSSRLYPSATLLANGKVLIAGGYNGSDLSSADIYNPGLGYADSRRPLLSAVTGTLCQPGALTASGTSLIGDSEGSSGSANSSATNAPLLVLRRVENDQRVFASPVIFSSTSFVSTVMSTIVPGMYRASIVRDAVPSVEQMVSVAANPMVGSYPTTSVALSGSTTVTPSLPTGYEGRFYNVTAGVSAGYTGTLSINAATGVVSVGNAAPTGTYTITVTSSSTICGSPVQSAFTLNVIGPPASITATGGTPQSAGINLPFVTPLQATVRDSAGHLLSGTGVVFSAPPTGASATFPGGGAVLTDSSGVASITATANGTLGSYSATATVNALTATYSLTNVSDTPANVTATAVTPASVSISWTPNGATMYEISRSSDGVTYPVTFDTTSSPFTDTTVAPATAYLYRVRAIAPVVSGYSTRDLATTVIFTDPSPSGVPVKAVHIMQLRVAVNAVRALAGLAAATFTDPTIVSGVTMPVAAHVTELRSNLDAARSSLTLPAVSYTDPTIVSGTTLISAQHILDLRGGVQ